MSADTLDTRTLEYRGLRFKVCHVADPDHRAPWEEYDGHGVVTDWLSIEQQAERDRTKFYPLGTMQRDGSQRFYDMDASIRKAIAEQWGVNDEERAKLKAGRLDGAEASEAQVLHRAVVLDRDYLNAWCNDEWQYIGVVVQLQDAGELVPTQSLWGIESNDTAYLAAVARELADQVIDEANSALEQAMYKLRELQEQIQAAVLDRKDGTA
jgi:hypothetical protein